MAAILRVLLLRRFDARFRMPAVPPNALSLPATKPETLSHLRRGSISGLERVPVGQDRELCPGVLDDGGVQVGEQQPGPAVELFQHLTERGDDG
jgi:hypothetical protein